MKLMTWIMAATLLTFVPSGAADDHCTDETAVAVGPVYIADEGDWIYLESDAAAGLQRGGDRLVVDMVLGHSGEFDQYFDCNPEEMDILLY